MSAEKASSAFPNVPYYVYAPPFHETSGGVRAMHYLCHELNNVGQQAYLYLDGASSSLNTPLLTPELISQHKAQGLEPVVIYPEVVQGNPLRAKNVVRYFLNIPGFLTNTPLEKLGWAKSDMFFTHGADIVPEGWQATFLQVPLLNTRVYNPDGAGEREGSLVWLNRFLNANGVTEPITDNSIEISYRVGVRTPEELAELYRKAELFYTYEHTTACFEALLCGCPVVYLPNPLFLSKPVHSYLGSDGVAWGNTPEAIAYAKATVHKVRERYDETIAAFRQELAHFIDITQQRAASLMEQARRELQVTPYPFRTERTPPAALSYPVLPVDSERVKVGVIHHDYLRGASFNLRLGDVLSQLEPWIDLALFPGKVKYSKRPEELDFKALLKWADVIIVQRGMLAIKQDYIFDEAVFQGKVMIFETDDWLPGLPASHVQFDDFQPHELRKFWRKNLHFFAMSVASTEPLAAQLRAITPDVTVVPNTLAQTRYRGLFSFPPSSRLVTIGFAGTATHQWDLRMIGKALQAINNKYGPSRVRFVFFGCSAPTFDNKANVVEERGSVPYSDYLKKLKSFDIDIGIAPLEDNLFNETKSDIKWLDYTAVGAASLLSDVPPYYEAKRLGLAEVVASDTDSWVTALERLIDSAEYRQDLARRSYQYLCEVATQETQAYRWVNILKQVLPEKLAAVFDSYSPQYQSPLTIAHHAAELGSPYVRNLQNTYIDVLAGRLVKSRALDKRFLIILWVNEANYPLISASLESARLQLAKNWQLICVADFECKDEQFLNSEQHGWLQIDSHAAEMRAQVVQLLVGDLQPDWFACFEAGTCFDIDCVARVAEVATSSAAVRIIYSDSIVGSFESHSSALHLPDFNFLYFCSHDYLSSSAWYRSDMLALVEQFDVNNMVLYCHEQFGAAAIAHIDDVLLAFPAEAAENSNGVQRALTVEQYLQRYDASAQCVSGYGTALNFSFAVDKPSVAILISNVDSYEFIQPCLESLFEKTQYEHFTVCLVDCGSRDRDVLALYQQMQQRYPQRFLLAQLERGVLPCEAYNHAAGMSEADFYVVLHNDVHFVQQGWLNALLALTALPDLAVVVPKLVYPETSFVQSAGLVLGSVKLDAIYVHERCNDKIDEPGYMNRLAAIREVSAGSSACALIRGDAFRALDGFDPAVGSDELFMIDFCLRANQGGLKTAVHPYSVVVHHQRDGTLMYDDDKEERQSSLIEYENYRTRLDLMKAQWMPALSCDRYHNRNLMLTHALYEEDPVTSKSWPADFSEHPRILSVIVGGASGDYRVKLPLNLLAEQGIIFSHIMPDGGRRIMSAQEIRRLNPDILYVQNPADKNEIQAVEQYRKFIPDLKVVVSLDDILSEIPENSSVYKHFQSKIRDVRTRMKRALALADVLVVSTEYIRQYYADQHSDIRLVPNRLPKSVWGALTSQRNTSAKPRVGWVGAQQHKGDLKQLEEVIRQTADRIEWVFMGMWPEEVAELLTEKHLPVLFADYPAKLASLNLDLALAPLEINEFNAGKSNLRLLEYGAMSWPVICSDIYPFRTQSPPVTYAAADTASWIAAIDHHLANPEWSAEQGKQLRRWVEQHYWLEEHLDEWYGAVFS